MENTPKLVFAVVAAFTIVQPRPAVAQPNPDAGQPAIECPLAKQGIHPADLRPFKDVEKYIAFLERPDRAKWQRPDAVVAALGLSGNETVVDVGAGSGYFSFRLARALPRGSVIAIDIQPEMKAGARLALIEFKEGKLPQGPPEHRKIPRARLLKLAARAGLLLDKEHPKLLPYQTLLVFRKP